MSTSEIQHISANGKIAQWRKKARNRHIHFHVTQKCLLTVSAFSMDQFLQPNLKRKACATVLSSFKQDQLRHVLYVSLWFFSFFFLTQNQSPLWEPLYIFFSCFYFWAKNALSYACQISECTAALQASHIRVVINGAKTPAIVTSVLFVRHAIEQIECEVFCGKGKWTWQYVLNCAVQILPVSHRAYRISIHPDNAASDYRLVRRCSLYSHFCSKMPRSVLEKSPGC